MQRRTKLYFLKDINSKLKEQLKLLKNEEKRKVNNPFYENHMKDPGFTNAEVKSESLYTNVKDTEPYKTAMASVATHEAEINTKMKSLLNQYSFFGSIKAFFTRKKKEEKTEEKTEGGKRKRQRRQSLKHSRKQKTNKKR